MSKERNLPASEPGSADVASDPLDELLLEMFLRKEMNALTELDDTELERLLDALAKEDPEASASLGSLAELIEEITSAPGKKTPVSKQFELPTVRGCDETVAEPGSAFYVEDSTDEFDQMIDNVDRFVQQKRVTYTSNFIIEAELGSGGQGIVYLIVGEGDFAAARALKIFSPKPYDNATSFVADMQRMKTVAKLIDREPHDDLVDIYWFEKLGGVFAMLMQYIDGFDLRRLLQPELLLQLKQYVDEDRWSTIDTVIYSPNGSQQLALQPAIAVYIAERMLRGVADLHRRGIVHGDIKPSNIMLNASGSVKIIDIGSAFEINSRPGEHYFSPAYSAPEFLEFGTMSEQSDLASVGYVLIELLSGKAISEEKEFDPDDSARTIGESRKTKLLAAKKSLPHRLGEILPKDILESKHLVELCQRLIDPDLNQRFPSAAESIVNSKGTYQFNNDLVLSNLSVCNFQEITQWLADVKNATLGTRKNSPLRR